MNDPLPATGSMPAARTRARIALAGNPNCGKTTIFNSLTGLRYKVANYPGVTVEKKEGRATLDDVGEITVIDLPGIYSLSGHSLDETIALRVLLGQFAHEPLPDLIVAVLDAANLERNLYLTTQLIDLGVPVVVAVNMIDVAELRGISIKREMLSRLLGVPVIGLSANKGKGIAELKETIANALRKGDPSEKDRLLTSSCSGWLQGDSSYKEAAELIGALECAALGVQGKVSSVLVGSLLFSESRTTASASVTTRVQEAREALASQGIDCFSYEPTHRYQWINSMVKRSTAHLSPQNKSWSDRLDGVITHKIWGSIIFVAVMGLIFQSTFLWATIPMDFIRDLFTQLGELVSGFLPDGRVKSLVVDGIIAGVGSVIVFVPQIAILFFFLGLLEDSGYLSRAAFLMDRVMRRFGLQGRSFIPLLSSFACAIPGIMSTRTIASFADRLTTILIAPLMSCSARLPVYTLLIAAFIPQKLIFGFLSLQGLVLFAMYLLGIIGAALVAWLLKATLLRGEPALFVMEMPLFRAPSLPLVLRDVLDRVMVFLKNAGTMILACSILLWFLASYPQGELKDSFAGRIGHAMAPVIEPLGFNWEIGVAILGSFAAREVFVSTLATLYNLEDSKEKSDSLVKVLQKKESEGSFPLASALSLMVFYVFACQCMSTLAVTRRETGSWGWTTFMFVYMTAMAYGASFLAYRLALAFLA